MIGWDMLKGLFKRSKTLSYPFGPDKAPELHRAWLIHDVEKCINCGMCVRVCPSGAAYFSDEEKDGRKVVRFNMGRCTFCAQCVDVCPVKCLEMSSDYERATTDKADLEVE